MWSATSLIKLNTIRLTAAARKKDEELTISLKCTISILMTDLGLILLIRTCPCVDRLFLFYVIVGYSRTPSLVHDGL